MTTEYTFELEADPPACITRALERAYDVKTIKGWSVVGRFVWIEGKKTRSFRQLQAVIRGIVEGRVWYDERRERWVVAPGL